MEKYTLNHWNRDLQTQSNIHIIIIIIIIIISNQ